MKIQKLHIKNFKSLVDLEIVEPNPFTVFVGANGVGKSNIFEALEFLSYEQIPNIVELFGGLSSVWSFSSSDLPEISLEYENINYKVSIDEEYGISNFGVKLPPGTLNSDPFVDDAKRIIFSKVLNKISRIFVGRDGYLKIKRDSDSKLNLSCSNLEKVLKRLLQNEIIREEIVEYLQLMIPEFEHIEIHSDNVGGVDTLLIYEKRSDKPFNKNLISDGTYNILCLLTALYQSDEPQFLCIEEPENGLTPDVIKEMVQIFRNACEEKGHYIWLNTHSQSLVSQITADELITVDKVNGETKIKQFKGKDFYGLRMDEAWLTNALGAGLPW